MALPEAVADHYRAQQRLIVATLGLTRAEWRRMGPDFDASWARLGPRIIALTAAAQLGAARSGAAYVPDTLAELGTPVNPLAEVVPEAFSGVASDGRPLDTLLERSLVQAKTAVGDGAQPADALDSAGRWLDMVVHTQIADAARAAASVTISTMPTVGWVRMVNPPCCGRCAILAGKWFKWNKGFRRHPRCDCRHIAAREDTADAVATSPKALFDGGHVKGLTEAERHALSLGADPGQVINAQRGMTADGLYTREGTTRRGYASYVQREIARQKGEVASETVTNAGRRGRVANYAVRRTGPRPTPEAIFRYTNSREEALQVLRANGYVVGDIRRVTASAL